MSSYKTVGGLVSHVLTASVYAGTLGRPLSRSLLSNNLLEQLVLLQVVQADGARVTAACHRTPATHIASPNSPYSPLGQNNKRCNCLALSSFKFDIK